jgi:hypothetical protein
LPGDAAHDDSLRPELSPALKASAGIDGDDRADRVLEMGDASHYREGHITTATLPATARVFSASLRSSGRATLTGDVREKSVEFIGCFVLDPMPCSRDNLEPGIWLDVAQSAGAIIEMGVGGRVALTPNPVDTCLDERKRPGECLRA